MSENVFDEEEQISEPFEDCGERPSVDRLPAPPVSERSKSRSEGNASIIKDVSNNDEDIVSEPTEDYEEGPITNRLPTPASERAPVSRSSTRISIAAMEREKKNAASGFKEGPYRLQRLNPPNRITSDKKLPTPPPKTGSSRISVASMELEKKVAAAGYKDGSYRLQRLKPLEKVGPDLIQQEKNDITKMEGSLSSFGEDLPIHLLNNETENSRSNSALSVKSASFQKHGLSPPPRGSTLNQKEKSRSKVISSDKSLSAPPRTTASSRLLVSDMEQEKKLATGGFNGGNYSLKRLKPPERMASDFTLQNSRVASKMEDSLSSLGEDIVHSSDKLPAVSKRMSVANMELGKKIAASGSSYHSERRKPPERKVSDFSRQCNSGMEGSLSSLGDIARLPSKKNSDAEGSMNSSSELSHYSSRMPVSDLEREKKIAAAGITDSAKHTERRQAPISIAASGYSANSSQQMNRLNREGLAETEEFSTIQPDMMAPNHNSCTSYDSRLSMKLASEGEMRCSIDNQILTDQMGREIDLDNEFAFLHNNIEGMHESVGDIVQDDHALPGAIAVFGADYDHDDMETDYVNPDNFEVPMSRRESAASEISPPTQILEERPRQQEETIATNKHRIKKKMWLLLFMIIVIVIAVVAVVVAVLTGGNDGSGTNPHQIPSMDPVPSIEPTRLPTPSPTMILLNETFIFEDTAFGSSLALGDGFVVVSNSSTIKTYELYKSPERQALPIKQVIEGSQICLSSTNRIAVVNGNAVKAYDYVDRSWEQIGGEIKISNTVQAISISGDGSHIATTTFEGGKLFSRIYILKGNWVQYADDIREDYSSEGSSVTNSLNHDGRVFTLGVWQEIGNQKRSHNDLFLAPTFIDGAWVRLSALASLGMLVGDIVTFSRDGRTLVVGGHGSIGAMSIDPESEKIYNGNIGSRIVFDENWKGERKKLVLAVTDDGTRIAFSTVIDNVQVFELQNEEWISKIQLPQMRYGVDSLSFSSDGKLAVGIRNPGIIHIFDLDLKPATLSSERSNEPSFIPSLSPSISPNIEQPVALSSNPSYSQFSGLLLEPSNLPSRLPSNSPSTILNSESSDPPSPFFQSSQSSNPDSAPSNSSQSPSP